MFQAEQVDTQKELFSKVDSYIIQIWKKKMHYA